MRDLSVSLKKRNSSVELLKIIAVAMIVFSHAIPVSNPDIAGFVDLNLSTMNIQRLVAVFMKYGGQVGNTIFVVCSAWFLLDSTKVSISKPITMTLDSFVISIFSLVLFLVLGIDVTLKEMIAQFIPLTSGNNWFVSCYIIYY